MWTHPHPAAHSVNAQEDGSGWLEVAQKIRLLAATEDRSTLDLVLKDSEGFSLQHHDHSTFAANPSAVDGYCRGAHASILRARIELKLI